MLEGLDLMLFEECVENLEQALEASANDRIEESDFPHEVRTLSMFLVSRLLTPEQVERVQYVLKLTRV